MITSLCLRGLGHAIALGYISMASILCTIEKCLFLLSLPFPCVAYSCALVDKKRSHHWCDTLPCQLLCSERGTQFLGSGFSVFALM